MINVKITVASVSTVILRDLIEAYENISSDYPGILDLKLYNASFNVSKEKAYFLHNDIISSDFVIIDLMGTPSDLVRLVLESLRECKANIVPIGNSGMEFLRLGSLSYSDMMANKSEEMNKKNHVKKEINPASMQKMMDMAEKLGKAVPFGKPRDMRNFIQMTKYWKNGGQNEITNMLYLILRDYGGVKSLPKPRDAQEFEDIFICDPFTLSVFKKYEDYRKHLNVFGNKPVVAILFYGHNYPNRTSSCVAKIAEKLKEFADVLPVAFTKIYGNKMDTLEDILLNAAGKKVDIIVNFMSFRIGAGPMGGNAQAAVELLKKINVPVLHPFFMSRRYKDEWIKSSQGISASEFLISIMLPELDGSIETYPVAALEKCDFSEYFDIEINELSIIEERAERLCRRIKKWLNVKNKSNYDKKAAIICYNYPPGENNVFGGAFLDTFCSIENILYLLNKNGYDCQNISAEIIRDFFTEKGVSNSPKWSEPSQNEYFIRYSVSSYTESTKGNNKFEEISQQWGTPPGKIMSESDAFLIPGFINGKVFIGLQPSRGLEDNPDKVYHDKDILPHHQYAAFYRWIKDEFKADVVIHVGTHGTLEFLQGKECGMSGDCFPDIFINDIPHIYIYYTGNPSEAMIAKRRSHALLIGYQPPVFIKCGLYGEIADLLVLIDEYYEAERIAPDRCQSILCEIRQKAEKNNLPPDIEEIETELYRIKRSLIPKGLHIFGSNYSFEQSIDQALFVLRYDRTECKSLLRIMAEADGVDYENVLQMNNESKLEELEKKAQEILRQYIKNNGIEDDIISIRDQNIKKDLLKTLEYGSKIVNQFMQNNEQDGLIAALNADYIPARLAGDSIRNPEVLPSGYNLFQFDPRFVPTASAYERGRIIAESTISKYYEQHNKYPDSTGIILWGLETSKTQGETIGQILAYLGVRLAKSKNVWEPAFEIIPAAELKRPRIDVVVNICGFFRDMFPNLIDNLNIMFEKLANLDEPEEMNFFKANCRKVYGALLQQGYSKEEAYELSHSRIFGPEESKYGTGITSVIENKNWTEETQIAQLYIDNLKYVYSKNFRGKEIGGLFSLNLKSVEVVSQIRSSHEYEVTDLDHYYEFFGGFAKSVETASGRRCEIYISDTTGEKIYVDNVEKAISKGVRTRLLNPLWIDNMLEHKYHGAQKIEKNFENIIGLSATTNRVEQWIYNSLHDKYVSDEEMRKKLIDNNKWAYAGIIERMMELNKRGYWNATEQQLDELAQAYLEAEGSIEDKI